MAQLTAYELGLCPMYHNCTGYVRIQNHVRILSLYPNVCPLFIFLEPFCVAITSTTSFVIA